MSSRQPHTASAAVLALVPVAVTTWWLLDATEPLRRPASPEYDHLLLALASWVLFGCAAWAVALGVAVVVESASSGRLPATAWVGCPRPLRRLLLTGVGVALVGAGPVQAPASASGQPPLPVPARPVGSVQADPQADTRSDTRSDTLPGLVVHSGDNLWRLAEDRLPPSAAPGEVAGLVNALHRRNRGVIGPDPDLIRPGQRLVIPLRIHGSQLTHHPRRHKETR